MPSKPDHISVCVCTFKRPDLLIKLLQELQKQKTDGLCTYSAVIVDNDRQQSAREAVEAFKKTAAFAVDYLCEPEQNIALARNRAVEHAQGDLIAFIDDDEYPCSSWLLHGYKAMGAYTAEAVLGPVKPYFETDPPAWIVRGKVCERESFATGTVLNNSKYTRTGNVLFRRKVFDENRLWFNPEFGRSGGEDVDFFARVLAQKRRIVWCAEACVYELVPPERLKESYFLKRALLRGVVAAKKDSFFSLGTAKSIVAVFVYTMILPFACVAGKHIFMNYLIRQCDHLGKLLAFCGLNVYSERTF